MAVVLEAPGVQVAVAEIIVEVQAPVAKDLLYHNLALAVMML